MLSDKQQRKVQVEHNDDDNRYTISYEGASLPAGHLEYVDEGDERNFKHTVVDDEYGGRGLASILVKVAAEDAASRGWPIIAQCPFVSSWMETNDFQGQWRKP
ncbi:GNAT family N-acetyltransferase [Corynebacterium cystitidis]|uniref:GNAT family N-acetyltransferase n=1 Tax=Corynebacterium cystitidis TaxID=35757 RepID=UPI00211EB14F|nr:GNAT family N-acetyltransferase [Corynebacterium cystitidis]